MSTGGSSEPFNFVISPTCFISGNLFFVTDIGKASISLAHTGVIPLRTAASGNPPIPSNNDPRVIIVFCIITPSRSNKKAALFSEPPTILFYLLILLHLNILCFHAARHIVVKIGFFENEVIITRIPKVDIQGSVFCVKRFFSKIL